MMMISQENFLGEFQEEGYTLAKDYIDCEVDQLRLYHTRYTPEQPKATICIVHGLGEHSGRYKKVATFFVRNGYEIIMVDLRGFGLSGGARGYGQIREFQNDVIFCLRTAKPHLPLFLYGHSMGGLISIKLLLDKKDINVSGCIITSPPLGINEQLGFHWAKRQVIKMIGSPLRDFLMSTGLNPTSMSKDAFEVNRYLQDRLMFPITTMNLGKHLFEAIDSVDSRKEQFDFPIMIFHGKKDQAVNYKFSENFIYKKVKPYKKVHIFPDGRHELQNDKQCDELLEKALKFIEELPNKKNFGVATIHPIPSPKKKKSHILKVISLLIIVLLALRRLKIFPFKK